MKRLLPFSLLASLLVTGCETDRAALRQFFSGEERTYRGRVVGRRVESTAVRRERELVESRRGAEPRLIPEPTMREVELTTAAGEPPPPIPEPPPPPPKPAPEPEEPPFGNPVPGKPGFVTSPHSPGAGYIDVTGMAPGSTARDPYSKKLIRVP